MPTLSVITGIILIGIGIGGYVPSQALTALIPAALGVLIAVCGVVARKEHLLKHAMHGAATVGLLGFVMPLGRLIVSMGKEDFAWGLGPYMLAACSATCLVFVALCVKSFIDVRRAREAANG